MSSLNNVLAQVQGNLGYTEGLNNDNKFAETAGHANHQPWCATFLVACFKKAGAEKAIPNSAAVVDFLKWGKAKKQTVEFKDAKRGDLILFDFTGSKTPQHIGIAVTDFDPAHNAIITVEGNTSAQSGSQANGDGVYKKLRQAQFVFAVVRPIWE